MEPPSLIRSSKVVLCKGQLGRDWCWRKEIMAFILSAEEADCWPSYPQGPLGLVCKQYHKSIYLSLSFNKIHSLLTHVCLHVVTQKLVLQQFKNVTAKCTETLWPPPSLQYLLGEHKVSEEKSPMEIYSPLVQHQLFV